MKLLTVILFLLKRGMFAKLVASAVAKEEEELGDVIASKGGRRGRTAPTLPNCNGTVFAKGSDALDSTG